jgi:nitrogen fixation protein NifB
MGAKVIGLNQGATGASPPAGTATTALAEAIQQRVENHPCYSEQAHHHFARIHVAVAPACNIQCHYCNRKYDCANEARPGVVSEVLTPEQGVQKTLAVAAAIPELAVVGIAGPGDPLANPERTFATFRALSEQAPDLKLCVSTNGLMLLRYVDELIRHNIGHVTITINCLDPDIGAKIYPWIFWNHRRLRGREAAAILIEQQLKGLDMLVARDVLVKVNSVMIPGVNDGHLLDVNRTVKARGAFLHNIMPLIAQPEHGTYYGVTGQRGPTPAELQTLQDACGSSMKMMRHCRQCRSDAIGLLGQNRSPEFTREKIAQMRIDAQASLVRRAEVRELIQRRMARSQPMPAITPTPTTASRPILMAVATKGDGLINEHFGRAHEFLIYEASVTGVRLVGHRNPSHFCTGPDDCGDHEDRLPRIVKALAGCEVLLAEKIGLKPWGGLEAAGIQPNSEHALKPIEEAIAAVYQEMLAAGKLEIPAATGRASA